MFFVKTWVADGSSAIYLYEDVSILLESYFGVYSGGHMVKFDS